MDFDSIQKAFVCTNTFRVLRRKGIINAFNLKSTPWRRKRFPPGKERKLTFGSNLISLTTSLTAVAIRKTAKIKGKLEKPDRFRFSVKEEWPLSRA